MQNTENYELDPNFAVVCSFVEKFGTLFGKHFEDLSIESLKTFLEDTEVDAKDLFYKFHISLLRGVLGHCQFYEFDKFIIKFCKDFPDGDDELIKREGYGKVPVTIKLRILKNLCEDQFQYNDRFNRRVNQILDEESTIRHEAVGKDRLGRSYWFMLDTSSGLRLFRGWHNELTCDETWNVVCREISELKELIALLEENESLSNDDKTFRVQPYQPSPKKTSSTELLPTANEVAAKALYFSSINSSPRFIKSPRKRSKLELRRDERKHKLPHCKVNLSRLKKQDFDKWMTKPYCASGTSKKSKRSLLPTEDLINLKSEKLERSEEGTGDTTVRVSQDSASSKKDNDEVIVKIETEHGVKCCDVSSLKDVVKENKVDSIDNIACKVNELKTDHSELCPVKKTEHFEGKIKCALKTESETTNVTIDEKPCPLKGREYVCKSVQSGAGDSQNVSKTCSENSVASSHVKTKHSDVNTVSIADSHNTERSGSTDDAVNDDNKVLGKKTKNEEKPKQGKKTKKEEKPKHSGTVSDDLDKFPEENAGIIINEKGDACSYRNRDCEVINDKTESGDRNVIKSAENAQDCKETVCTDDKKTDTESDIFNAAIKELLTLESNAVSSSVVNAVHKQNKCSGAKTAIKDEDKKDNSESDKNVKDTSDNDKKVLDKALNDLIQLEMMTKGSTVDKVSTTNNNGLLNKVPASKPIKELSKAPSTAAAGTESSTHFDSNSKIGINNPLAGNKVKNETMGAKKLTLSPQKVVIITHVNANEKPNVVKEALKGKLVQTSHKTWANLHSADAVNTQNVCKGTNVLHVIPSKGCDSQLSAGDFLNKVTNIIHGKDSVENVESQESGKSKCKLKENETLKANVDGEKLDTDKEMNLLVGDEMVRIEVASNSTSDTDSAEDETDKTKALNTSKEKSVSKTRPPLKAGLNIEKAAINSLYTNSSSSLLSKTSDTQSGTVLSSSQALKQNVVTHVPKLVVKNPLPLGKNVIIRSVNSSALPIQQLLLPGQTSIPNSVAFNTSILPQVSSSVNTVYGRPKKPTVISVLKNSLLPTTQSSSPIILGPFNIGQAANPVQVISGTVTNTPQLQTILNTGVRQPVTALPQPTRIVYAPSVPIAPNKNQGTIKLSLPSQSLGSSNLLPFSMARQQPLTGTSLVYLNNVNKMSTLVSSNSRVNTCTNSTNNPNTVKLALKKHLETPVQKMFVSSDKKLQKTQPIQPKPNIYIGADGVHYDAVTNQPIVHPANMSYVIAGPGGKYYDKATGYLMDIPESNNFKHIPGKVYLAADAKFANGVKKQAQKTTGKKKSKKKKEDIVDTSDEEFEKLLESCSDGDEKTEESSDEDYDYEQISKRVKTAKNLKLPSRRASVESEVHDSELEVDNDEDLVPIILGRNAKRAADRQFTYHEDKEEDRMDQESDDDIGSCKVCGTSKHPATILLCDECDDGYHMSCLSPPLSVVPPEDWFCPNCQHNMLVAALKTKLELAKKAYRKAHRYKRTISPTTFSINSSNILELERRSCRNRKEVSYDEKKYDKMVVDAVKEMNSVKKRKLSSGSPSSSSEVDEPKDETKPVRKSRSQRNTKKQENDQRNTRRLAKASKGDTKTEEGDDSTSLIKHKRGRLTATEPVSEDSGSEYVQSDNSSISDHEASLSAEADSPEKKTYLTLSGRATKNVSYK